MAFPASALSIITTAVAAMRVVDGYSHDYGPANVYRAADWVLPQGFVIIGDEAARPEQRLGAIEPNLPVAVRVICPAPIAPTVLQDVLDAVEQDFKRLLIALDSALRAAGMMRADYLGAKTQYRLVAAAPAEVTLSYTLWYRQMRRSI